MTTIIVYYQSAKILLSKVGYKLGYQTVCTLAGKVSNVTYWFKDKTVIQINSVGDVVKQVKHCNDTIVIETSDTSYDAFLQDFRDLVMREAQFNPSILSLLDGVAYKRDSASSELINSKVFEAVSHMDKDFIELFKFDLHMLTDSTGGGVIEPARYDLFVRKDDPTDVYVVTDVLNSQVIIRRLTPNIDALKAVDVKDLDNQYSRVAPSTNLRNLLFMSFECYHSILNAKELYDLLLSIGCTGLEDLKEVKQTVPFSPRDYDLPVDRSPFTADFWLSNGQWVLRTHITPMCGMTYLYPIQFVPNDLPTVSNAIDAIIPHNLYDFVTGFLSTILQSADFVLKDMPEEKSYFDMLLKALSSVEVPIIDPSANWSDFLNDFDPMSYIRTRYNVDPDKLPKASVADCKTPEACDKLYTQLKDLIS